MKKILSLLTLAALAACTSYDQQPAPFETYGSNFYGKDGRKTENANANYVRAKKLGDSGTNYTARMEPITTSDPDEYNRRIDEQNSSRVISSRPLNTPIASGNGEFYSHQTSDNSGIARRPLAPVAIDGNQQAVPLSPFRSPTHIGGSGFTTADTQHNGIYREPIREEESVPPVESKEGFVNPSQLNEERKASNSLDKIKPVPKPKITLEQENSEEETVKPAPVASTKTAAETKPKIEPKIKNVETATVTEEKTTVKTEVIKPNDEEDDSIDEADDVDNKADEEELAKPAIKTQPVEIKESASVTQTETVEIAEKKPAAGKAPQFIKPVDGQVVSEFGGDKVGGGFNDGISIQAPEGTPVKAASGGTVVYSGNQLQGYGNLIIIRHPNGFLTSYSHLKELELKKGENVAQGDVLGHVGKTGNVETPQLHFGIRKGREPVDPKGYL